MIIPHIRMCGVQLRRKCMISKEDIKKEDGRCMQPRAGLGQFPAEQPRAWAVWAKRAYAPWAGAGPGWLRHCEHMPVLFVCRVPPSPQCDWTSEPKKSVHHHPLVSGWKSDTEETSKQKKLKQREPPWKWQMQ